MQELNRLAIVPKPFITMAVLNYNGIEHIPEANKKDVLMKFNAKNIGTVDHIKNALKVANGKYFKLTATDFCWTYTLCSENF